MKSVIFSIILLVLASCSTVPDKKFDIENLAYQQEIKKINKNLANGIFLISRYQLKDSRRFFKKALDSSRKIQYNDGIIAALNNLGVIFLKEQNDEALTYFQQALEKSRYAQDKADCYNNIGFYYLNKKDKKSLEYFTKALKLNKNTEKKYSILNNIGLYYSVFHNPAKARSYFKKVIKKSEKKHYYKLLIKALINMGDTYLPDDVHTAETYYKTALNNAHFWEYDAGLMSALEKLTAVVDKNKNPRQALLYYKALSVLHKKFKMDKAYNQDLKIIKILNP